MQGFTLECAGPRTIARRVRVHPVTRLFDWTAARFTQIKNRSGGVGAVLHARITAMKFLRLPVCVSDSQWLQVYGSALSFLDQGI